ncbi:unnamed protein product [Mytilus coruscus]|uniref:Uncharacterized protein n=1 Tax=Mytilus coruscus TaxID=42192 RepID=A0A6J8DV10_MYTCO|nr:unnamed protein product [Mytilus coruscus]
MLAGTLAEASSDNNLDPTFRTHKIKTEIENPINRDDDEQHNRYVQANNFGMGTDSLLMLYKSVLRSVLDYGCQAFNSASITVKSKLDIIQAKGLRILLGAHKSTLIETILAESGEMPLQLRRDHLSLKYYARTKQNPSNPVNQLVDDCIEYQIYNHKWNDHNIPYRFRFQNLIKDNDLEKIKLVTKNIQDPPPRIIGQAKTSSNIKDSISKKENPHIIKAKALEYIDNAYKYHLKIYTDGSKDPASGKTGYAFIIPSKLIASYKRTSDNLSVYTTEMTAMYQSLKCLPSQTEKYRSKTIEWIPAHVGILGNEQVDKLAKLALRYDKIDLNMSISANEFIAITTALYKKKWQARWDNTCSLWSRSINNTVNKKPTFYQGNRYHTKTITRLRFGTTLLPGQLGQYILNVSPICNTSGIKEDIEHVLVTCINHSQARQNLQANLDKVQIQNIDTKILLDPPKDKQQYVWSCLVQYLTEIDYHKFILVLKKVI